MVFVIATPAGRLASWLQIWCALLDYNKTYESMRYDDFLVVLLSRQSTFLGGTRGSVGVDGL